MRAESIANLNKLDKSGNLIANHKQIRTGVWYSGAFYAILKREEKIMKKQAIAALLALLLTVPLMSGCGKQSEPPDSAVESTAAETSASSSDSVDSAQEDDTFTYDGTFNEEVYQHIIQNIELFGHKISMPCTLADLGEDFSIDHPIVDKEALLVTYSLNYQGEYIGCMQFAGDRELTAEEEMNLSFCGIAFDSPALWYVAGIMPDDSYQHMRTVLGEPNDTALYDDDQKGYVGYYLSDDESISFYIRKEKVIDVLVYYNPQND